MSKIRDCKTCVGGPECELTSKEETVNNVCSCGCHQMSDGFGPLSSEDY